MPSIETAVLVAGLLLLAGTIAGKLSDRWTSRAQQSESLCPRRS
jgi:hypothetical protein